MSAPVVIIPTIQRSDMDCGLCCLQMLADRPYDVIRDEAIKVIPRLPKRGMFASELQRIGARFGLSFRKLKAWGDDEVGVLDISFPDGGRHFAVLFRGVIINPSDGMVWDEGTYLTTKRGTARALYAVED